MFESAFQTTFEIALGCAAGRAARTRTRGRGTPTRDADSRTRTRGTRTRDAGRGLGTRDADAGRGTRDAGRGTRDADAGRAGGEEEQEDKIGLHTLEAERASPHAPTLLRLASPARTHARTKTKRIRFPGWTHTPNLRPIRPPCRR